MSTTILRPLANSLYTEGRGVAHFYPFLNPDDPTSYGPGVRLGDMDALTLTVEVTDGETRFSKEYDVKTATITPVDEISCKLDLTVAQLSETAVMAALMGKRAPFTQAAQTDQNRIVAAGEVVFLGGFDAIITEAVVTGTQEPALIGTDYLFDSVSGQLQAVRGVEVTYSIPAVSDRIKIGIASGEMPRGMLIFRGVAKQGKNKIWRIHDVQLKPSGGLDLISEGILTPTLTATCSPVSGQDDGFSIGVAVDVEA